MYKLVILNENKNITANVEIDQTLIAITSSHIQELKSSITGQELILRSKFAKTNSVYAPLNNSAYKLTWKDNLTFLYIARIILLVINLYLLLFNPAIGQYQYAFLYLMPITWLIYFYFKAPLIIKGRTICIEYYDERFQLEPESVVNKKVPIKGAIIGSIIFSIILGTFYYVYDKYTYVPQSVEANYALKFDPSEYLEANDFTLSFDEEDKYDPYSEYDSVLAYDESVSNTNLNQGLYTVDVSLDSDDVYYLSIVNQKYQQQFILCNNSDTCTTQIVNVPINAVTTLELSSEQPLNGLELHFTAQNDFQTYDLENPIAGYYPVETLTGAGEYVVKNNSTEENEVSYTTKMKLYSDDLKSSDTQQIGLSKNGTIIIHNSAISITKVGE